jgi:hypothetical protein
MSAPKATRAQILESAERIYLQVLAVQYHGCVTLMARHASYNRTALYRRLVILGIDADRYRPAGSRIADRRPDKRRRRSLAQNAARRQADAVLRRWLSTGRLEAARPCPA